MNRDLLMPEKVTNKIPHCMDSADPAEHVGPFKILYVVDQPLHRLQAEECLTCGLTVVRKLEGKPGKKPKPKSKT